MEYQGKIVTYKDASVKMNIIKEIFSLPYMIKYIEKDLNNFGSIVGFKKNSDFLSYLYNQDKKKGFQIIMRIDWQNNLIFKDGVYETDKLPATYLMKSIVNFPSSMNLPEMEYKFCYSNRVDVITSDLTYFAVKQSFYPSLYQKVIENYNSLSVD